MSYLHVFFSRYWSQQEEKTQPKPKQQNVVCFNIPNFVDINDLFAFVYEKMPSRNWNNKRAETRCKAICLIQKTLFWNICRGIGGSIIFSFRCSDVYGRNSVFCYYLLLKFSNLRIYWTIRKIVCNNTFLFHYYWDL